MRPHGGGGDGGGTDLKSGPFSGADGVKRGRHTGATGGGGGGKGGCGGGDLVSEIVRDS